MRATIAVSASYVRRRRRRQGGGSGGGGGDVDVGDSAVYSELGFRRPGEERGERVCASKKGELRQHGANLLSSRRFRVLLALSEAR